MAKGRHVTGFEPMCQSCSDGFKSFVRACFNVQWCTKCAVMTWNVQWWKAIVQ